MGAEGPVEPLVASGSQEAFAAFYDEEHAGQVRRASLLVGSIEAAHDVVHDAFVAVWQRWGEIERPGPYLERCVLNGCRDVARRRRTRRNARLPAAAAVSGSFGDVELLDALAALPFNHRAAVVLRFYGEMSEAEIAVRLDCRPGSVGPWIQRGVQRLRRELPS